MEIAAVHKLVGKFWVKTTTFQAEFRKIDRCLSGIRKARRSTIWFAAFSLIWGSPGRPPAIHSWLGQLLYRGPATSPHWWSGRTAPDRAWHITRGLAWCVQLDWFGRKHTARSLREWPGRREDRSEIFFIRRDFDEIDFLVRDFVVLIIGLFFNYSMVLYMGALVNI